MIYMKYIITWNKNKLSKIHDHSSNGCILKLLKGKLLETRYNNKLEILEENIVDENSISYIKNENGLHNIKNISDDISVSIHIYSQINYKMNIYN